MPNRQNPAISRRIKRANSHLETIIEMIKQGHSRAEISQQIQAVESATENAKQALIHDHIGLGLERSVKSKGHIQGRQADREISMMDEELTEPEVLAVSEEEDSRIFMRFAKDLGFDLDALHFHFRPEKSERRTDCFRPQYRHRTMTASKTKPTASLTENDPSEGVSRVRFSPLRVGEASRVILVAVGSRVILFAIMAAVLWSAITLVS
jgi:DNA-binding FrmR family transcriptional regulator